MTRLLRIVFIIILLIFAAYFLERTRVINVFSNTVGRVASYPMQSLFRVGRAANRVIDFPLYISRNRQEIDNLQIQISRLTQENVRFVELYRENAELRRALNFFEKEKYPLIAARITNRVKEGGSGFFTINRGSDHGTQIGNAVVVNGVLVGKIVKTLPSASIAALLNANGIKTAAAFAGSEKTIGIVNGELNTNLVLRLIPKDITVDIDALVITSGMEKSVPRGLAIGRVARLEQDSSGLFQTAYLNGLLQIDEIMIVGIVKGTEDIEEFSPLSPYGGSPAGGPEGEIKRGWE